jgi:hypothetical protein
MRSLKEKVPKEGVSPSMALLVIAVAGTAILSIGTTTPAAVFAQEAIGNGGHGTPRDKPGQPTDPNCFGEISTGAAQIEDSQPGLGAHASDPIPGDDDRETPRAGVGNQDEDTPGEHAQTVGPIILGEGACEPGPSAQN